MNEQLGKEQRLGQASKWLDTICCIRAEIVLQIVLVGDSQHMAFAPSLKQLHKRARAAINTVLYKEPLKLLWL
jgi:hypothetical protein